MEPDFLALPWLSCLLALPFLFQVLLLVLPHEEIDRQPFLMTAAL
jgi:hypothetical protein